MVVNGHEIKAVQRRTGIFFFILSLVISIINILNHISKGIFNEAFTSVYVVPIIIMAVIFLLSAIIQNLFFRVFQVSIMFIAAGIAICDSFASFFGYAILVLAIISAERYHFFKKYLIIKSIVIGFSYFSILILSSSISENKTINALGVLIFILGVGFYIHLLYKEKVMWYFKRFSGDIKREQDELKQLVVDKENELGKLKKKLDFLENPGCFGIDYEIIDKNEHGLSNAEMNVVKAICSFRGSNTKIAENMCLSIHTLRSHLSKIYKKTPFMNHDELRMYFCKKTDESTD